MEALFATVTLHVQHDKRRDDDDDSAATRADATRPPTSATTTTLRVPIACDTTVRQLAKAALRRLVLSRRAHDACWSTSAPVVTRVTVCSSDATAAGTAPQPQPQQRDSDHDDVTTVELFAQDCVVQVVDVRREVVHLRVHVVPRVTVDTAATTTPPTQQSSDDMTVAAAAAATATTRAVSSCRTPCATSTRAPGDGDAQHTPCTAPHALPRRATATATRKRARAGGKGGGGRRNVDHDAGAATAAGVVTDSDAVHLAPPVATPHEPLPGSPFAPIDVSSSSSSSYSNSSSNVNMNDDNNTRSHTSMRVARCLTFVSHEHSGRDGWHDDTLSLSSLSSLTTTAASSLPTCDELDSDSASTHSNATTRHVVTTRRHAPHDTHTTSKRQARQRSARHTPMTWGVEAERYFDKATYCDDPCKAQLDGSVLLHTPVRAHRNVVLPPYFAALDRA